MKTRLYILLICSLVLIKLILVSHLKVSAIGGAFHDDELFLSLAAKLFTTGWFGPYSEMTLAKGWGYPIFIAANFLFGLPLLFTQQLFYTLAGLVLIHALAQFGVNRKWLLVLFALYLFNPVTCVDAGSRVLRMGIYPALTVFVFAGAMALLAGNRRSLGCLYGWGGGLGVAWGWFWITREEGMWILPSILLILAAAGVLMYRAAGSRRDLFFRWGALVLPLAVWGLILGGISAVNKMKYGIYATNEFKHPAYLAAYGALSRVDHPDWQPYLAVPKDVRHMIYEVSPAFRELETILEGKGYYEHGCPIYPHTCGDIASGWFMWALRDAVSQRGYCQSGEKAMAYYRRLADEVNQACRDGRLKCGPERAGMRPPMRREYLEALPMSVWRAARLLTGFTELSVNPVTSTGTPGQLYFFQDITQGLVVSPADGKTRPEVLIRGWAYRNGIRGVPDVRLASKGEDVWDYTIHYDPSPDLVTELGYESADHSRFEIRGICPDPCTLRLYHEGALVLDVPLQRGRFHEKEDFQLCMDVVKRDARVQDYFDTRRLKRQTWLAGIKTRLLARIVKGYQWLTPFLFGLALLGYLIRFVRVCRRRFSPLFIVNTALLGAMAARVLILALIDTTSFPVINWVYMSPAAPLLLIFIVLGLVDGLEKSWFKIPARTGSRE